MTTIEVFSPAKINTFLAVTGRRDDGFHDLVSVVAQLDFGDDIEINIEEGNGGIEFSCSDPNLPTDSSNLAVAAAEAYLGECGVDAKISIRLEKRIPSGAGLGGGSSNAAAVLRALNGHFKACDPERLSEMAAKIGSDCPLFLGSAPCIMRGRGEIIESLPARVAASFSARKLVIFKPSFSISTPWAYSQLRKNPGSLYDRTTADAQISQLQKGKIGPMQLLENSFQSVADQKFSALPLLRSSIQAETGVKSMMSGSGSACFAFCNDFEAAAIEAIVRRAWGPSAFFQRARILD